MKRVSMIGILIVVLVMSACGRETEPTSTPPPPASADEIQAVCDRYETAKDLDIGAMWEELLDVAPTEIRAPLVRLTAGSPEGYWEDRATVEDFLDRCGDPTE